MSEAQATTLAECMRECFGIDRADYLIRPMRLGMSASWGVLIESGGAAILFETFNQYVGSGPSLPRLLVKIGQDPLHSSRNEMSMLFPAYEVVR